MDGELVGMAPASDVAAPDGASRIDVRFLEGPRVMLCTARGEVTPRDFMTAMARYFDTPRAGRDCGGVWDLRDALLMMSLDEVSNQAEALRVTMRPVVPRRGRVALLVSRETDRVIATESRAAARLSSPCAYFDDLDEAIEWASGSIEALAEEDRRNR